MQVPALGHRSPEFKDVIKELTQGLRYLFQTKGNVVTLTGSASLGMEAAVSNVIGPGDKILVLENGKFGERFAKLAKMYAGDGAVVVKTEMGQPWNLAEAERLIAGGGFKAVACVANESSAGVANPAARIAELCKQHDAFFLLDGVTAVGGADVPVDKWGVDACIVGSQKCIGAPAGLSYLALSDEYLAAAKPRSLYGDLKSAANKWNEGTTPFTPATHLFLATAAALKLLAEDTLESRIERCKRQARAFRAAMAALGLNLLPPAEIASETITAVRYPAGAGEKEIRDVLKNDFGIVVAGGQDELKGKIMRVGHMGFARSRELVATVGCIEQALSRTTHPTTLGAGVSAFLRQWGQQPAS